MLSERCELVTLCVHTRLSRHPLVGEAEKFGSSLEKTTYLYLTRILDCEGPSILVNIILITLKWLDRT